jgi:hypothetical protein
MWRNYIASDNYRSGNIRINISFDSYLFSQIGGVIASVSYCSGNMRTVIASESHHSEMVILMTTENAVTF